MTPGAEIELKPHWWKASALTTRPTLPPENTENMYCTSWKQNLEHQLSESCFHFLTKTNSYVGQVIFKVWSYIEATIPHSTGLATLFCTSCICVQQARKKKCKGWCKIQRSESRKIWHPHESCRGFQANVEIYHVFLEIKSKFGLRSPRHSNCNLHFIYWS